jgi:hypothetical protein
LDTISSRLGGPNDAVQNLNELANEFRLYWDLINNYKMDDVTAKATIERWKLGERTW